MLIPISAGLEALHFTLQPWHMHPILLPRPQLAYVASTAKPATWLVLPRRATWLVLPRVASTAYGTGTQYQCTFLGPSSSTLQMRAAVTKIEEPKQMQGRNA